MAKLNLLRRALEQAAEEADQAAAAGGTVRERFRALGRADAYRHALTLLTNAAPGEVEPEEPAWPTCQGGDYEHRCLQPAEYGSTQCRLHNHRMLAARRALGWTR